MLPTNGAGERPQSWIECDNAMNSAEVRADLVSTLRLDLVGPEPGHAHENEALSEPPSRFYLCGFLVPFDAPEQQKFDPDSQDEIDGTSAGGASEGEDEPAAADRASARKSFFPSSIGLSVLVPKGTDHLRVEVSWGDYTAHDLPPGEGSQRRILEWRRTPRLEVVSVPLKAGASRQEVPNSDGLILTVVCQPVRKNAGLLGETVPAGSLSVALFLVNERKAGDDDVRDAKWIFQARLKLQCEQGFVARPSIRGHVTEERDEDIADVRYRDAFEFAVGHGNACWAIVEGGVCRSVETTWTPSAEVEKVEPGKFDLMCDMEALAGLPDPAALMQALKPLVSQYGAWVEAQQKVEGLSDRQAHTVKGMLAEASQVAQRISSGIETLADPSVFLAFQLANRTMAAAAKKRGMSQPSWRPFQLAFILMNLRGIADPKNAERETVDLLFFATGGGKTEAYLGLAAFTLVLRRLRNPGVASAGMSVLMRYTLRLLTLDQLSRATALICALELEREKDPGTLGPWAFEIGLWVGKAATPNLMGRKGDGRDDTARAKTLAFQKDPAHAPSPIPLENCPWCNSRFSKHSFQLQPNVDLPTDLVVHCAASKCEFNSKRRLPVVAVDEVLYRRAPCFVIATVDKLASLPFEGRSGVLFGLADRYEPHVGFFGPCDTAMGQRLERRLLPPDLIIQDELHLISGPLGTMVGLYETAIDSLCEREVDGTRVRPKVVASTATVRRAADQVKALFARPGVQVFPPPGPDRRDSFFSKTVPSVEANARQYLGVAAPGRSLKVVMLRTYLALLARCGALYQQEGGARPDNPADPYMTLLGYFNALRELGGSRRIIEEEVKGRLPSYPRRKRVGELVSPFGARELDHDPVELTSREPTHRVSESKRRLNQTFNEKDALDVAIATNMISVGLDVQRLGLMVVLGQPRMTSEYIQATSRVGRDDNRPGLVVTLLNIHKPRDRSHYERFEAYHASFYRAVEVTSVTPFAPRAIDRGLPAILATLARHGSPELTAAIKAVDMGNLRATMTTLSDVFARRVAGHAILPKDEEEALVAKLRGRTDDLLDSWAKISQAQKGIGGSLRYQRWDEVGGPKVTGPYLLIDPLDPELQIANSDRKKFKAQRSLRDVEPSVPLFCKGVSK